MKLIVGLGNPGKRYENTPHNVGSHVVERLADRLSCNLKRSFRLRARVGRAVIGTETVLLAKPRTWMNESGVAASAILRYYKIGREDLIVVLDDADLEIGRLRIRDRGGSGGHKGLISVSERVGGDGFVRLRVGVGRSDVSDDLVDHILRPFGDSEREAIDKVVDRAADALVCAVEYGTERAMNEYNGNTD